MKAKVQIKSIFEQIAEQVFVMRNINEIKIFIKSFVEDKNINNIARDTTKKIVKNVSQFLEEINDDFEDNSDENTIIKNLLLDIYDNNDNQLTTGNLTASSFAQFQNIRVDSNVVTTTVTNTDLSLQANGSGRVIVPTNNVEITNDLRVLGNTYLKGTIVVGTATAGTFTTGDAYYTSNYFNTTLTNSNLELRANGTGNVQSYGKYPGGVIINGANGSLPAVNTGFYLKPVRDGGAASGMAAAGFRPTYYNPTTGEFVYSSS
jgi:hypothetical protein